jgi:hypothetical protein
MDDTIEIVLENYRDWLGNKPMIFQSDKLHQFHSSHFSILSYEKENHFLLCTAGASKTDIPNSKGKFGARKSCAYEYMIHAQKESIIDFHEILFKVSLYPHITRQFLMSGDVVLFDEKFSDSQMKMAYLTYPYQDDDQIYSRFPNGQLILPKKIIQTLWVVPIYSSEANFIRESGAEKFDEILGKNHKELSSLNRKNLLL